MADYKLSDMLGIAGATIGIIIAGGILLGWLGAKYIDAYTRFRQLTSEHRNNQVSDSRRGSLQDQISSSRRQVALLCYGSLAIILALLAFLVTVGLASLSVIYPKVMVIRTLGTVCLFIGLALIGGGLLLSLAETVVQRMTLGKEVADFSDIPSAQEALSR